MGNRIISRMAGTAFALSQPALNASATRRALSGFFLSGLLFSLIGVILPAWGYHLKGSYLAIARYFFSLNVGILISVKLADAVIERRGVGPVLAATAGLACAALLWLAFASGPYPEWWRAAGLAVIGLSIGGINTAIFHGITPSYIHDPVATVNMSGMLFGIGGLCTSLLVSGAFYVYTVPSILILLAAVPGLFAIGYARAPFQAPIVEHPALKPPEELRGPAMVLITLLLFFQFGNEWSIAGWLPVFVIQRLGINPATGILLLAAYWLSLLIGRIAAQAILPRVSHMKILGGATFCALLGCTILSTTDNLGGATIGILLVGCGYAPIYPLVIEKIGYRFPYYHPGFFNGVFSLALSGALLAPWLLGFVADRWGIAMVMTLPSFGSLIVFLLVLVIWLEARLFRH